MTIRQTVLVETFLEMITLKISFLSGPVIFFNLDVVYESGWASICLLVNLSITNLMSDGDVILTCFEYFLDCLQPGLFGVESIDIGSTCIGGNSAKNTYIGGAYIESACIRVLVLEVMMIIVLVLLNT